MENVRYRFINYNGLKAGGINMAEDMQFFGESKNVEYKVTVPEKSEKYMKTVVAFANGRGGKIVFGIDDKTLDIVGWMKIISIRQWMPLQMLFLMPVNRQ